MQNQSVNRGGFQGAAKNQEIDLFISIDLQKITFMGGGKYLVAEPLYYGLACQKQDGVKGGQEYAATRGCEGGHVYLALARSSASSTHI